jgi:DNA helicase-2/ATP-dependent DNA helicase PcrA
MTSLDSRALYISLFKDIALFNRLTRGLTLPEDCEAFRLYTLEALEAGHLPLEDATALAYLKLRAEGHDHYGDIRQVVIDEAQDYHPLHCAIFKELFPSARFTVIGDHHQTVGSPVGGDHYALMARVLDKPRVSQLTLTRSYRSTVEITAFARGILAAADDTLPFLRHGDAPILRQLDTAKDQAAAMLADARKALSDGFGTAVMLCRTRKQARELYRLMDSPEDVCLVEQDHPELDAGLLILPIYLAKGLEFDAALVADADDRYHTEQDRRLLYIACTRALHRLCLYTSRNWSPLIP